MPATPIQFREFSRRPQVSRAFSDQRFEQAAGYLSPADLGINGLVIPNLGLAPTAPIYSPGWASFTGYLTPVGGGAVFVEVDVLDPQTQAVIYGPLLAAVVVVGDDTAPFNFGTGGQFSPFVGIYIDTSDLVWLMWRMVVGNSSGGPVAVSLELVANSRCSR
ncbi:MAG TPA: hypothetical protein VJL31_12995 [Gemmatimonadales bacterium]|nr:hypothetical protein [Gemmatimonadales bacterium]